MTRLTKRYRLFNFLLLASFLVPGLLPVTAIAEENLNRALKRSQYLLELSSNLTIS